MQGNGVPHVPSPTMPGGVAPNWTQQPAAPFTGFAPPGFPPPPQPGTYPNYYQVPGPAALGPTPGTAPPNGAGGVAGVSMAPVPTVAPPTGPGGPHALPGLPGAPLPQGFPNPFGVQQVTQNPAAMNQPQPGQTTVTGPMGYHPGLGYFPTPTGSPPSTAFPSLPGSIQTPQFQPSPQAQQPAPQAAAALPQPPQPGAAQAPNPFWLQLAWQLVQTPAVRQTLGDSFTALLEGEERMRALSVAAGCLAGAELQGAFKALTAGQLEQARFTELFAQSLRHALQGAGLRS